MRLDPGTENDEGPSMTPLIDVVFLLLIFFLVATTFQNEEVEMDLELPQAQSGKASDEGHTIIINVRRDGALVIDGRPVSHESLEQKLRAAARRDKNQEVLIRGDTSAQFGVVARVLDVCRAATLTQIAIGAAPQESGR